MPKIFVGTSSNKKIFWSPEDEHNPHLIICGSSGSGKTYTIKRFLKTLSKNGVICTIIDKHGDMYDESFSNLKHIAFNKKEKFGLNPLKPLKGTTTKDTAYAFTDLLTSLNTRIRIGDIQENMLHNAIMELYMKNNVSDDDEATYESCPDLVDLVNFLKYKYKKILIGESDYKEMEVLYKLHKEKSKLLKLEKKQITYNEETELEAKIDEQIEKLTTLYKTYLKRGILMDKDFLIYTDPKALINLINKISNINKSNLFIKNEIDYNNSIINIKQLEDTQKKIFAYYLIRQIYTEYVNSDIIDGVKHYLIIDEAQFYMDVPQIANLLIKICQEGRKFGLGLILATQNPLAFDINIVLNTSTKIIMAIDPIIQQDVVRKFSVEPALLNSLTPKKNLLFSSKYMNKGFISVNS